MGATRRFGGSPLTNEGIMALAKANLSELDISQTATFR